MSIKNSELYFWLARVLKKKIKQCQIMSNNI